MKKTKQFILLSSIIFISSLSYSQSRTTTPDWYLVGQSEGKDSYFIKSNYVNKDDEGIKIWAKISARSKTLKKIVYKNVTTKTLFVFNCFQKTYKLIKTISYSSSGKIIENIEIEDWNQKWDDVIPDSMAEELLLKACELFN